MNPIAHPFDRLLELIERIGGSHGGTTGENLPRQKERTATERIPRSMCCNNRAFMVGSSETRCQRENQD